MRSRNILNDSIGPSKTTSVRSYTSSIIVNLEFVLNKTYLIHMNICMVIMGTPTKLQILVNYLIIPRMLVGTRKISFDKIQG